MPIPSVSSSLTTTTTTTTRTTAYEDHNDILKCKSASITAIDSPLTTKGFQKNNSNNKNDNNRNDDDAMETETQTGVDALRKTKKKKVLLLHARREDDDQVVNLSEERLRPVSVSGLYAGSKFHGTQKCGTASYEVNVELLHVNMEESTMSGYLKIKGLTSEFPELTTFFQAEIMGRKYSFHTRKWQADQKSDLLHWKKFPSFKPYVDIFNNDGFVYDPAEDSDYIYMRWKETFLVPDHHVSAIHGASFAGFYYICYQRSTNQIKGYYFFRNHKDWFQELTLNQVNEHGFGTYEFR